MICQAPTCGKVFEAKRKTAKYCSRRCSMRASRSGELGEPTPAVNGQGRKRPEVPSDLERWTYHALAEVKRVETWAGQAALVLARRIDAGGAETGSALASMVTTHAAAMDRALAEAAPDDPVARLQAQVADELAGRRANTGTG